MTFAPDAGAVASTTVVLLSHVKGTFSPATRTKTCSLLRYGNEMVYCFVLPLPVYWLYVSGMLCPLS